MQPGVVAEAKTQGSLVKPWKKTFGLSQSNSGKLFGNSGRESGALLTDLKWEYS